MKTLGLIGGTSWESTIDYYRLLNQGVRTRAGGYSSCRMLLSSVNFADFVPFIHAGDWAGLGARLAAEARMLEQAGAQAIVLCTNTMHKVAPAIQAATSLPFLDIRNACGHAIVAQGLKRPLLLGTRYVMEDPFYADYLRESFGLAPLVPKPADQLALDAIIFGELVKGVVSPASKAVYLDIIAKHPNADGIIFGCTEIGMLISQADCHVPTFNNLQLHVEAALDFAFSETRP